MEAGEEDGRLGRQQCFEVSDKDGVGYGDSYCRCSGPNGEDTSDVFSVVSVTLKFVG
jgi:hypothetical protein